MGASSITISVVIPCYNVEAYVEDSVLSALRQTYAPLEIICIDDGSTDDTLKKLRLLEGQYRDVIKVHTGLNRGAPTARNQGLEIARGDYIQFLDSDDVLGTKKLEYQAQVIQNARDPLDLVVGDYTKLFLDGSKQVKRADTTDPWVALLRSKLGITSSNLWLRSALVEVGGWKKSQASSQEAELMFRLLQYGAKVGIDKNLSTILRQRTGSISNSREGENWKRYIELRYEILTYLQNQHLLTSERKQAAYQALFQAVKSLHSYDPSSAIQLYHQHIPASFSPSVTLACTRAYVFMFKILGFERTERFRTLLKR